jgi:hypothetical protein
MEIESFYRALWADYIKMTPQAQKIHQALLAQNPGVRTIINDHVAFRTYNRSPIQLEALEQHLLNMGYQRFEPYQFHNKHLSAWGYIPPQPDQPRVFLSELLVEELSSEAQAIIERLCVQINPDIVRSPEVFYSGTLWEAPTWQEYQRLLAESEYAAWLAIIGLRANHFTVSVNQLDVTTSLSEVLDLVESIDIPLNLQGGRIKGNPEVLLEQGSTLADRQSFQFKGGEVHEITTCYYEFAKRYPTPDGSLYQGFVAASADKIFESTDQLPKASIS